MKYGIRPQDRGLGSFGFRKRIRVIRGGLFSLQQKAGRLQLAIVRKPIDIDTVFQAQRLSHRK